MAYDESIRYRRLDEDGDYMFGRTNAFLTGREALTQAIQTRLKVIKGEWWEGDSTALPFMSEIIGKVRNDKSRIDLMVIGRITDTIGVISVSDVKSTLSGRNYSFSCKVKTVYGETQVEVGT